MQADEKLAAYLAGAMPENERLAFEAELLDDPAARGEILEQQRMSAALRAVLAPDKERILQSILAVKRSTPLRFPSKRWTAGIAAAAAIVVVGLMIHLTRPAHVASVKQSYAAVWDGAAPELGKGLTAQTLVLKRGAVELEFSSGAKGVLEGPARLRLISGKEVQLEEGKLLSSVPPAAHGFTVRGKDFAAVDLGTEFGVIAGTSPEVHVFEGKVEFQGSAKRLLGKTQALRVSAGALEEVPALRGLFADERRLAALQAGAAIDADPRALVHFDFAREKDTLPNRAASGQGSARISGCRDASGRWPGSQGLQFADPDDAVSFAIPGPLKSASFMAWVRVDGLPNRQCSLLMSSSELPGAVHWYLHQEGALNFAIVGPNGQWRLLSSERVMVREEMGTWKCFGVTFDGMSGETVLYLDGKRLASSILGPGWQLQPGEVMAGNWALREGAELHASKVYEKLPGNFRRNLRGRIDELAVFSGVLSPDEMRSLYEQGRP